MGNKLSYPEVDLSGKVVIVTGGNTGIGYETAKGLARLGAHTFIACRSKERAEGVSSVNIKPGCWCLSCGMLLMQAIDRMKTELHPESSQQEEERAEEKEGEAGVKPEEGPGSEPKETEQSNEGREAAKEEGAESKKTGIKVEYLPLDLSSFQSTIDCVRAFKEKNLPLHILINNAAICAVPYSEFSLFGKCSTCYSDYSLEGGGGGGGGVTFRVLSRKFCLGGNLAPSILRGA